MSKFITVAETAKIVRSALKVAFPGIKFSVRSKSYSGGASIDVSWQDGPTAKEVEYITNKYQGASFDGMQDLKSYHTGNYNGEKVYFGADFIFTTRTFSVDFLKRRAFVVASKYGQEVPEVYTDKYGNAHVKESYAFTLNSAHGMRNLADLVFENARKTRAA